MRTLETALRTTTRNLLGSVNVSMVYFPGSEPYWSVSIIGRGALHRTHLTACGRNPLAVLRAMLSDDSLTYFDTVPCGRSLSAAVHEVEALAEAHGLKSLSIHYYDPLPWHPNGWFGVYAHLGGRAYTVHSSGDSLRDAAMSALDEIRAAA